jgi:DNA helicase-2/ATP-dependent DNA helicase PcrA
MNFNENQLKAINKTYGSMVVFASAGSGKTAVLCNRVKKLIEDDVAKPEEILCVTFSKKAKENMYTRIEGLIGETVQRVNIETFHSLSLKIIKSINYKINVWTTKWEKDKKLCEYAKSQGFIDKPEELALANFYALNSIFKNIMETPNLANNEHIKLILKYRFEPRVFISLYVFFENYKKNNNLVEFDDMLNLACELLENNPIKLNNYQKNFKFILADEFQDTSMNKAKLIKLLSETNKNVFVVGDFLQNIYGSFTGSSNDFIVNFKKDYDAEVVNLNTNYRCSKNIVDTSNLFATRICDTKLNFYVESVANKSINQTPKLFYGATTKHQAAYIVSKIKEHIDNGGKYTDIGILGRTNAVLQNLQIFLSKERIPFDNENSTSFIEDYEIKLLVSYLILAEDADDNDAFNFVYNKPNRHLGNEFIKFIEQLHEKNKKSYFYNMVNIAKNEWKFKKAIDNFTNVILDIKKLNSLNERVNYLIDKLDLINFIANKTDKTVDELKENFNSFSDLIKNYKTIKELLDELRVSPKENVDKEDKINMMTIHKSKGLEFPIVFLVNTNDGIIPHGMNEDLEEEKRLFYVAMTRAEKELYLCTCDFFNGKDYDDSCFLQNILKDGFLEVDKERSKEYIRLLDIWEKKNQKNKSEGNLK